MTNFQMHNINQVLKMPELPVIPSIPTLKGKVTTGSGLEFKDVLTGMLGKVNSMMDKSDKLAVEAVTTGNVDLHEVMIASEEEEIALGITTQVASKFVGTIEKLTQMQV